jgi:hypothetical protein
VENQKLWRSYIPGDSEIARIQMRNDPHCPFHSRYRNPKHSKSFQQSPPPSLHSPLRKIRDLIIFVEIPRKCAMIDVGRPKPPPAAAAGPRVSLEP